MNITTQYNHADNISFDNHIGCFGEFNLSDAVCRHRCVLSLRCAIETEQNIRFEMLEDFIAPYGVPITFQ